MSIKSLRLLFFALILCRARSPCQSKIAFTCWLWWEMSIWLISPEPCSDSRFRKVVLNGSRPHRFCF